MLLWTFPTSKIITCLIDNFPSKIKSQLISYLLSGNEQSMVDFNNHSNQSSVNYQIDHYAMHCRI